MPHKVRLTLSCVDAVFGEMLFPRGGLSSRICLGYPPFLFFFFSKWQASLYPVDRRYGAYFWPEIHGFHPGRSLERSKKVAPGGGGWRSKTKKKLPVKTGRVKVMDITGGESPVIYDNVRARPEWRPRLLWCDIDNVALLTT